MDRQALSLGRIWGIPFRVDYSWFLILAILTWMLAVVYRPAELVVPTTAYWILGAATAILFFASVLLHEMGHVLVAKRFKMPAPGIVLYFFGGVPETVSEPASGAAELLVALAGPCVSLGLAVLFAGLAGVSGRLPALSTLANYLTVINGSLALVNLIPGLPLDGGRVWRVIVSRFTPSLGQATRSAGVLGRLFGFLFIAVGAWQVLTGNLMGLWLVLLGWFLEQAAARVLKRQELTDAVATYSQFEKMNNGYVRVPAEMTLQQVVDRELENVGARAFLVERSGIPVGVLTWWHINAVPRTRWQTTLSIAAMSPFAGPSIHPRQGTTTQPSSGLSTAVQSHPPV